MCDRVAILARGRLVTEGRVTDVLATGRTARVVVRAEPTETAVLVLRGAGMDAVHDGDRILVSTGESAEAAAGVTRALASQGIYVSELRPEEVDLETVFLDLTGGVAPGDAPAVGPDATVTVPPP